MNEVAVLGAELPECSSEELFSFQVDPSPLIGAGVAGGAEEFVVEDRAGGAEEVDDASEVPLPGVLVAEDVNCHRRRMFVQPGNWTRFPSLRRKEEPGDRQPEGAGERRQLGDVDDALTTGGVGLFDGGQPGGGVHCEPPVAPCTWIASSMT